MKSAFNVAAGIKAWTLIGQGAALTRRRNPQSQHYRARQRQQQQRRQAELKPAPLRLRGHAFGSCFHPASIPPGGVWGQGFRPTESTGRTFLATPGIAADRISLR